MRAHYLQDTYSSSIFGIDAADHRNDTSKVLGTAGAGALLHTDFLDSSFNWYSTPTYVQTNDDIYLYYCIRRAGYNYRRVSSSNSWEMIELFDPRIEDLNLNKLNVSLNYTNLALIYFRRLLQALNVST